MVEHLPAVIEEAEAPARQEPALEAPVHLSRYAEAAFHDFRLGLGHGKLPAPVKAEAERAYASMASATRPATAAEWMAFFVPLARTTATSPPTPELQKLATDCAATLTDIPAVMLNAARMHEARKRFKFFPLLKDIHDWLAPEARRMTDQVGVLKRMAAAPLLPSMAEVAAAEPTPEPGYFMAKAKSNTDLLLAREFKARVAARTPAHISPIHTVLELRRIVDRNTGECAPANLARADFIMRQHGITEEDLQAFAKRHGVRL